MPADIILDTNVIRLTDGETTVDETLSVNGGTGNVAVLVGEQGINIYDRDVNQVVAINTLGSASFEKDVQIQDGAIRVYNKDEDETPKLSARIDDSGLAMYGPDATESQPQVTLSATGTLRMYNPQSDNIAIDLSPFGMYVSDSAGVQKYSLTTGGNVMIHGELRMMDSADILMENQSLRARLSEIEARLDALENPPQG